MVTSEQAARVEAAIIDRTSQWADANCRRDSGAVLDMFDGTDDLMHAENGKIFPSYAAVVEFVQGWYANVCRMELSWEERRVIALAPDAGSMTGIFRYEAETRSGEVYSGRNVFTGVFTERSGQWKLVHGHESAVPSPESA
jgi:ketosteroid isomerase-like protein